MASRAWGIPPWDLRQALADNKVTLQDLMDVAMLESATSMVGENVFNFIDLEGYSAIEKRKAELKQLTDRLPSTKDPEERKKLLAKLTELNKNAE